MYKQRGEIVTVLTVISLGLMLMGIVAGKVAVQQTTQTQSKADCDPGTGDPCPTDVPATPVPETPAPKATDIPPTTAVLPTPDKKTDSCLNCDAKESCVGDRWCGNDCQYHNELNYRCVNGGLPPSPTGPRGCTPLQGCSDTRWCGNDGVFHDELNYMCNGSLPPSPTGSRACNKPESCDGKRWCGNDWAYHDELNYPKGCSGGTIGALPPSPTPTLNPLAIPDNQQLCYGYTSGYYLYYDSCVNCYGQKLNGQWGKYVDISLCNDGNDSSIPTIRPFTPSSTPTSTPTPTPIQSLSGQPSPTPTIVRFTLPTITTGPEIPTSPPQTGNYCISGNAICKLPPIPPQCTRCDMGNCINTGFMSATCKTSDPKPVGEKIPLMPEPKFASAQSWGQLQILSVENKVNATQISAWVYEAAKYYYPGIKSSFCDPMKGECDFKL